MTTAERPPAHGTDVAPSPPEALGFGFAWTIVELAPDGILVCDDDGLIVLANRHVEGLFGYDHDEIVGARVEQLVPVRFRHAHERHRAGYAASPALRRMGDRRELFGCRSDGSEFPVEISLSPMASDLGAVTVVVIRDVSEQRAHERDARTTLVRDEDERIGAALHDRVISHLFSSGLTLASVLSTQLAEPVAERLRGVVDELDTAIREVRRGVFAVSIATQVSPESD
jgi:two-component system sensor histidine kinase DevS